MAGKERGIKTVAGLVKLSREESKRLRGVPKTMQEENSRRALLL
jgi:hypothetical protein